MNNAKQFLTMLSNEEEHSKISWYCSILKKGVNNLGNSMVYDWQPKITRNLYFNVTVLKIYFNLKLLKWEGIRKLHWPDFVLFWPPTYQLFTFVDIWTTTYQMSTLTFATLPPENIIMFSPSIIFFKGNENCLP